MYFKHERGGYSYIGMAIPILAELKKWDIRAAHPYHTINRETPPRGHAQPFGSVS